MVGDDKVYELQFEYLTATLTDRLDRSLNAFKLFLQLFSAIAGGSVWLSMQPSVGANARLAYATLSNILVWLVIAVTALMVFQALRSWWGYRKV
jgi:hypothetical protein